VKPNYPESLEELWKHTTSVSKKSFSFTLNRAGTPEEGSSSESEFEEFPASRDQLKARVYSLLREKAHVPFASPPRIQKNFIHVSDIVIDSVIFFLLTLVRRRRLYRGT
jgi:hypothetical protein